MDRQVGLVIVHNPFKRTDRDIKTVYYNNEPLSEVIDKYVPKGINVVVSINGKPIPKEIWDKTYLKVGDQVLIVPKIEGGGHDKGGVLGAIAAIAISVVSMAVGGVVAGAIGGWAGRILGAAAAIATNYVGGMLVNAILPPAQPKLPSVSLDFDKSNTYSWSPQTTQQQGLVVPKIYGKVKAYGNVISTYLENVNDKQYLNVLIDLGLGPIKNITDIQINDQPISNFSNVTYETRLGNLNQTPISNFNVTKVEHVVNVKVTQSTPYTYTTPNNDFDALEIDIVFPQGLWYANNQGGLDPVSVTFQIEKRKVGDTYWEFVGEFTVSGSKNSAIRRTYKTETPIQGQYEIKVTRITQDRTSVRYGDEMYLYAVREVYYDDFEYPRHALVGIKALATDQLSGSFRFSCIVEGSLVRVWDGSQWNVQWSDNPAWICYDILTQPVFDNNLNVIRYDGIDPSRIDLVKFKEWADFCDELVPDGKGGQEKRCTFNGIFDTEMSMWEAALKVCEVGRAALVFNGTHITVAIDKPSPPVQLFSVGNIVEDSFREIFLPLEERATEIEVDFINAERGYERDNFTVYNANLSDHTYKITLQTMGITKPSEAWRYAMYHLALNENITRTIEFEADIDAIACTVGDVILVQHDIPQWGYGGRIVDATADTIVLDRKIPIDSTKTYTIMIRLSDDTVVERNIVTPQTTGEYDTFNVTSPFTTIPEKYNVYTFGEVNKVAKPFRVLSITKSQEQKVKITAVEYNETIYNIDYNQPVSPTYNYSLLPKVEPVTNLYVSEIAYIQGNTVKHDIIITFDKPTGCIFKAAKIYYQRNGDEQWVYAGETSETYFRIPDLIAGETYRVKVVTVSAGDFETDFNTSPTVSITLQTDSYFSELLDDITSFTATVVDNGVVLEWSINPQGDFTDKFEIWLDGNYLTTVVGNTYFYSNFLATGQHTFSLYAIDKIGNKAQYPINATVTIDPPTVITTGTSANVTWQVIENSVVFELNGDAIKGTYPIDHYLINGKRVKSESITVPIDWVGTKTFTIIAVDVAGNQSEPATIDITFVQPNAPMNLTTSSLPYAIHVHVDYVKDVYFESCEIWASTTNDRNNAVLVASIQGNDYTLNNLDLVDSRYFWARIKNRFGYYSDWYPSDPFNGVLGTTDSTPNKFLPLLQESISESELTSGLKSRINWLDTESFILEDGIIEANILGGIDINLLDNNVKINTTEIKLNVVEDTITLLSSRVDSAEDRISGAESRLDVTENNITLLSSRVDSAEDRISGAESRLTLAEDNIELASQVIVGDIALEDGVVDPDVVVLDLSGVNNIDNKIALTSISLNKANIKIDALNNNISLLSSRIDFTNNRISSAESRLDVTENNITLLSSRVDSAENRLSSAESRLDVTENNITQLVATTNNIAAALGEPWNETTHYYPNDYVTYKGKIYKALQENIGVAPDSDPNIWQETDYYTAAVQEKIDVITDDINNIKSEWTIKTDVNGHVAGIGLINSGTSSEFIVNADKFAVVNPTNSTDVKIPFVVGNVNGNATVGIDGSLIVDGSISANKVSAAEIVSQGLENGAQVNGKTIIQGGYLNTELIDVKSQLKLDQGGRLVVGDDVIQIDSNSESIIVSDVGGPTTNDYVKLNKGDIEFWRYDGTTHVLYKALKRVETGTAQNGQWVQIPGIFKNQPKIILSPANLQSYNSAYSNQNQSFNLAPMYIQEDPPGSGKWKFMPVAELVLSANTVTESLNITNSNTSDNTPISVSDQSPPNTQKATITFKLKSIKSTGTAGNYYYRRVTVDFYYIDNNGNSTLAFTKTYDLPASLDWNQYTEVVTPSATGQYTFKLNATFSNKDGSTFSTGTTYEYSTDSISYTGTDADKVTDYCDQYGTESTITVTLPSYTPPSGWEIYQVDYDINWSYYLDNSSYDSGTPSASINIYGRSTLDSVILTTSGTYISGSRSVSTSLSYYENRIVLHANGGKDPFYSLSYAKAQLDSVTVTIHLRRPVSSSTTPDNEINLVSITYDLAESQVLAEGTINWMAIGD